MKSSPEVGLTYYENSSQSAEELFFWIPKFGVLGNSNEVSRELHLNVADFELGSRIVNLLAHAESKSDAVITDGSKRPFTQPGPLLKLLGFKTQSLMDKSKRTEVSLRMDTAARQVSISAFQLSNGGQYIAEKNFGQFSTSSLDDIGARFREAVEWSRLTA